ncbi:hypothetical protein V6N11_040958 [Hibiscus sabdariffa]|uniref:Uncharacterized protein n=1 Tax=Hibiscus sabdariffa TaxID=183260 RepID=A0ABR2RJ24_9ROSI
MLVNCRKVNLTLTLSGPIRLSEWANVYGLCIASQIQYINNVKSLQLMKGKSDVNIAAQEVGVVRTLQWTVVEPLGSGGRQVLLWWLRVEARADSKFPLR